VKGKTTCRLHSLTPEERKANASRAQAASVDSKARAAQERERKRERARMSTKDRIAEVLEELQGDVEAAYRAALTTGSAEDLRRAQAAELLMSRVHGRPAQPTRDETPTVASSLEELERLSLEELSALARGLPADPEPA
jgi:hypothetical protein